MKALPITLLIAVQSLPAFSAILISESFGGSASDPLHGTTADIYSGITNGSSTWNASSDFKASGAVVTSGMTFNRTAYLSVGSYINDSRGTATGKFILTATIAPVTEGGTGAWASVGFLGGSSISLDGNFAGSTSTMGYGNAILRKEDSSASDYFGGVGATGGLNPGNFQNVISSFTITLDFTPAGGYNGTTNFGTATFSRAGNPTTYSYTYTSQIGITAIGITTNASGNSVFSDLVLTQVPEPSTMLLSGVAGFGLLLNRRRSRP